jgi:hypothetical protein
MKTVCVEYGSGLHKIEAVVTLCGKDISAAIGGGDTPHVGAAAVASPRESLKKDGRLSSSASVLCVMGHKDDMAAREAALRLAAEFNCNAAVSVGLHIDNAGEDDFVKIQANFKKLIEELVEKIKAIFET